MKIKTKGRNDIHEGYPLAACSGILSLFGSCEVTFFWDNNAELQNHWGRLLNVNNKWTDTQTSQHACTHNPLSLNPSAKLKKPTNTTPEQRNKSLHVQHYCWHGNIRRPLQKVFWHFENVPVLEETWGILPHGLDHSSKLTLHPRILQIWKPLYIQRAILRIELSK